MEYNVINNSAFKNKDAIVKLINKTLVDYSRVLYGFTQGEYDLICEYDILTIMSFYYSKMNADQKELICDAIEETMNLADTEETIENLAGFIGNENDIYVPLSCKLIDKLGDSRITSVIYESLFSYCKKMVVDNWNQSDSYSNYLALLNYAYFDAVAYKLHIRNSFKSCAKAFYGKEDFDDLIESLYEKHLDDLGWDNDVELDVLEEMIGDSKHSPDFTDSDMGEYTDTVRIMDEIKSKNRAHHVIEEDKEGFELIVQKTGIKEYKCIDIQGFECHFCEAKLSSDEYIIVYQKDNRIANIIDKDDLWGAFQKELYYADLHQGKSTGMVYIIYILDENSDNIPIQIIESNKTYGRKYVFTEEETITFINGIVRTTGEEIAASYPVQEWDRILREEHLTGCLTEAYSNKKVEKYLMGERFDADYVMDDDYALLKHSEILPIKWIKSLDTTGFRDFCFAKKSMEFGQINLFFGANGSGKTSVLEAIEYALTSEVRRVKDFKVKMPSSEYPKLSVYDKQAGVHKFNPAFSKKNNKEIERVWYGVPIGRTKSNLNENFNRFNAFDSEAAYKFIHESDNSEDSYASMFGNLMFGESVVDHEKKWQRFKRAFEEKYSELRDELNNARTMERIYEESLAQKNKAAKSADVERALVLLRFLSISKLPKDISKRYPKLMEELSLIRKYVDYISAHRMEEKTFSQIEEDISRVKSGNQRLVKEKKEKTDEITKLTEQNGEYKKRRFEEQEKLTEIKQEVDKINVDIKNWSIVQNVLSHGDTIKLAYDLVDELAYIEKELLYISKIEQFPTIISFLKLDSYDCLSDSERQSIENEYNGLLSQKQNLERKYEEAKKAYGIKEQQVIELRKIGKNLVIDSKCPLCGHKHDSIQHLLEIIDSEVVVDDGMNELITDIQDITKRLIDIEKILDREKLIKKAKNDLSSISMSVPVVEESNTNYSRIRDYILSKEDKEKRKNEIIEQQSALDRQGFTIKNIQACKEYKNTDPTYREYIKITPPQGGGSFENYLNNKLLDIQNRVSVIENKISEYDKRIRTNEQTEEIDRNEIRRIDSIIEGLDIEGNRELEQAVESIKTKFDVTGEVKFNAWEKIYHDLYDKTELEVERLESESSIKFEKEMLEEYKTTIKRDEPMVARCARAVQAFEKMPSLSSFVEQGIKNNIQQISKFFKWMHHSGEFERLGIDSEGIYAIRGLNHERILTYQMSTGQRATIAMAVMFALHMAAPDAPQFLLLDEPLATMDDTQVLNVLDILKSMAEQGTQIFFTTANGIMINLFKECFKNTDYEYKEYQFVKRVNRPSEIKESSVNDVKTIEELTLDDLTLDFNQFAQIREVLRKNQEKLVSRDEWEFSTDSSEEKVTENDIEENSTDNFFCLLSEEEQKLLLVIINNADANSKQLKELLSPYPMYRAMFETINEKAVDYFGETIVENDGELPWMEDDYRDDLLQQYEEYSM